MKTLTTVAFIPTVLLLVLAMPLAAQAQGSKTSHQGEPIPVSVCDLFNNPAKYNHARVRVQARVSFGFEDFILLPEGCMTPEWSGVWVAFGGDQSSPAVYCCADGGRKKGRDIKVEGLRIQLMKDDEFKRFMLLLKASPKTEPDGQPCESCNYYDVTATLEGRFFSGSLRKIGVMKEATFGGYGHLGCCTLFVIERVLRTTAQRTAVAAYESYDCKTDEWTATEALPMHSVEGREDGAVANDFIQSVWGIKPDRVVMQCPGRDRVTDPRIEESMCYGRSSDHLTSIEVNLGRNLDLVPPIGKLEDVVPVPLNAKRTECSPIGAPLSLPQ